MSAVTIYTTNFNNYDVVHPPSCVDHPYFCFTDARSHCPERGAWRPIAVPMKQQTFALETRWYKTHPHETFPHAEWTLYLDASLELHRCPLDFLDWCRTATAKPDCDLYLFQHPDRDCLYDEAAVCVELGKDTRERVEPHVAKYRAMAFPEHKGLWFGGVLLRRNTAKAKRFNELWWWEIINGSHRDQISLPVVLHYAGMEYATLAHGFLTDWFTWRGDHTGRKPQ